MMLVLASESGSVFLETVLSTQYPLENLFSDQIIQCLHCFQFKVYTNLMVDHIFFFLASKALLKFFFFFLA